MTDINEKLADIQGLTSEVELANIKVRLASPGKADRVVCPFNKRYVQLPVACIGYRYVCPHLDRVAMACRHPDRKP